MKKDWIIIHKSVNQFETELKCNLLKENGINAVIMNQTDSSYQLSFGGEYKLLVLSSELEEAKLILDKNN